ncbi:MAG: hypothetical protein JNM31_01810 [Flavobacteriales bacterium]|nr:hypothetical protein [Flavobacteriales bacterium]
MRAPLLSVLMVLSACLQAQGTRVLFIGNSLTYMNDLPGMFGQLAVSMGEPVQTSMVAPAGMTLQGHSTHAATQAAIAAGPWDFVVLQEQSQLPSFPPSQVNAQVFPFAAQLVQQIRAVSPCAEVVFLMTWGYENGDLSNCASFPPLCTYEGMQLRLRESYVQMADDNASWCAPAGMVWRAHRDQYPTVNLYADPSHPNGYGTYVAATTLASTIFRRSCTAAGFQPGALSPAEGDAIRSLASAIVLDSLPIWNIGVNHPVADANWTSLGGGQVLFANNTVGAATQAWDFGDGGTSTDTDPVHTYGTSGPHTVTLITWDACGRGDTLTLLVDPFTSIASSEAENASPLVRVVELGRTPMLQVDKAPSGSRLRVHDLLGQTLSEHTVTGPEARSYMLPAGMHGVLLWSLVTAHGERWTGRIMVP